MYGQVPSSYLVRDDTWFSPLEEAIAQSGRRRKSSINSRFHHLLRPLWLLFTSMVSWWTLAPTVSNHSETYTPENRPKQAATYNPPGQHRPAYPGMPLLGFTASVFCLDLRYFPAHYLSVIFCRRYGQFIEKLGFQDAPVADQETTRIICQTSIPVTTHKSAVTKLYPLTLPNIGAAASNSRITRKI